MIGTTEAFPSRRSVRLWLLAYLVGTRFLWLSLHFPITSGHGTGTLETLKAAWAGAMGPLGLHVRYIGEWFCGNAMMAPAILIADLLYLGVLFALLRREISIRELCVWAFVAGLPFVFGPRFQSNDISEYLLRAKMQFVYHMNPYYYPGRFLFFDPVYLTSRWHDVRWIYGPLFLVFLGPFAFFAKPVAGFVLLRAATFLLHLANGVLVWKAADGHPRRRIFLAAAYLFAPLMLVESGGNAHNDFLMIFFLLAAVILGRRGRTVLVSLSLACAVLVKIYAAPILACYVMARASQSWKDGVRAAAPAALLAAVLYLPFWTGASMIHAIFDGGSSREVVHSLLSTISWTTPLPVGFLIDAGLVLTVAAITAGMIASYRMGRWEKPATYVMFFWCAIGSGWFWPWYVAAPAALALSVGDRPIRWGSIALMATSVGIYMDSNLWAYSPLRDIAHLVIFIVPIGLLILAWKLKDEALSQRVVREWAAHERVVLLGDGANTPAPAEVEAVEPKEGQAERALSTPDMTKGQ